MPKSNKEKIKNRTLKTDCQHLDWDNERDCINKAEYACMCCGVPVCREHKDKNCPYGGMSYIEL